ELADALGYPVAVKAAGGGGGIGFRVVHDASGLTAAFEAVQGEGERFFRNGAVYLERYFDDPRHVEVQVIGGSDGAVLSLGERDCSIQRRHQKLVEETPAPTVGDFLRNQLARYATDVARHIGYTSAGTVEGLLVGEDFYFLEMNTRLQVEHPVTELVSGVDLVQEQLRVAAGLPLGLRQEDVRVRGVAIECRINAERAEKGFLPSPGTGTRHRPPSLSGVRVDWGVAGGSVVPPYYASLLAKVIAWGETREAATALLAEALAGFEIDGVSTLIPFPRALLATDEWRSASTC